MDNFPRAEEPELSNSVTADVSKFIKEENERRFGESIPFIGNGTTDYTNLPSPDEIAKAKDELESRKTVEATGDGSSDVTKNEIVVDEPVENGENGENSAVDDWMDILGSGHLKKKVITPGVKDSRPQKFDVLKVKYVGKLEDGTVVENVELIEINLGDNEIINGLDMVLSLMDRGEEAEVIVRSRFAFGDLGRSPDIPPGATLYYNITLIDFDPEPLISTLNVSERLEIGLRKKERGNWWYTRDEYTLAINCYRRAIEYFDDTEFPSTPSEEGVKTLVDERLKTYNNLGASQIKISGFDAALISFGHVLSAQPNNVKALFRKSTILKEKGELQEAISVIQKALSIEPDNRRLQNDLQNLLAAQRRDNTKQRDLYKKMMGNSQDSSDKKKTTPKSSKVAIKWLAFATAFAVAMASIAVVKYNKM